LIRLVEPAERKQTDQGIATKLATSRFVRSMLLIACFAISFFLLQRLAFLLRFPPYERTTLWVPGALTFSALLVSPVRGWWHYYIGLCVGAYAAYYGDPQIPSPTALLAAQFHFASVAAGVYAIRRFAGDDPFSSVNSMLVFVGSAGVLVPLATSLASELPRLVRGEPDAMAIGIRSFLCGSLGILIATPAITTALIHGRTWLCSNHFREQAEGFVLAISLLTVGLWVFTTSADARAIPALVYLPIPFLLWASLRFEVAGASWALLAIAYLSTWNAIHGRGPFASGTTDDHVLQLQLFLMALSLPLLFLAVGIRERRRAYSLLVHEMEERRRMEEQLRHASRVAALSEFTASIAHEINQPLGAILSNADAAELLLENPSPPLEEVRRILIDIRNDDLRASDVIKKLRTLLRRGEIERRPVEVKDIVQDVVTILRAEAERRGIDVRTDLSAIDTPVMGDRVHLQQVLLNLMVNGMEAMHDSPAPKQLTVSTSQRGDQILVSVSDRGPGIPSDSLPRLFERFFSTKREGMGMGLAISRSLVEEHGGRIWAENGKESGAVFRFSLPPMEPSQ
jgi:signal transduction histidine kinase